MRAISVFIIIAFVVVPSAQKTTGMPFQVWMARDVHSDVGMSESQTLNTHDHNSKTETSFNDQFAFQEAQ